MPADQGRPYPQLLRTPGLRWWRPLISLVVAPATILVLLVALGIWTAALAGFLDRDVDDLFTSGPSGFLLTNLMLAATIPVSMVAIAAGFGRRPGWLGSVEGHLRWGWLWRAAALVAVWAIGLTAVWTVVDGLPGTGGESVAVLLAICLLTTPVQAAGEEYLLRGWLTQSLGAWFSRPALAGIVTALVSATAFAMLHGQQNPWLFTDRFAFGLISSALVWRTGGLEASIVLHAGVNIASMVPSILEGTLDDSLTQTDAPPLPVLLDVAALSIAAVLLLWAARRRGLRRLGRPEGAPTSVGRDLGLSPEAR